MKKIIVLIFILGISLSLNAAEIPGLLFTQSDTLQITLVVPGNNVGKFIQRPRVYDSLLNKRVNLDLSTFDELRFECLGLPVRLIVMPSRLLYTDTTSGFTMLELVVDGTMKFYYQHDKRGKGHYNENGEWVNDLGTVVFDNVGGAGFGVNKKRKSKMPIVQYQGERPIRFFQGSKKRWIMHMINDCDELVRLINQRKFRINEKKLELVIEKYNELCGY